MPMHIEKVTSKVHVSTGDLPFSEEQLERLVHLVCARIATEKRNAELTKEATELRREAASHDGIVD
jgi:hypothetical protein